MMRTVIAAAGALAAAGTLPAYQYEKSGYPPPAPSVTSSSGRAVETGRCRLPSTARTLEARSRTFSVSDAEELVTTPFVGTYLILR